MQKRKSFPELQFTVYNAEIFFVNSYNPRAWVLKRTKLNSKKGVMWNTLIWMYCIKIYTIIDIFNHAKLYKWLLIVLKSSDLYQYLQGSVAIFSFRYFSSCLWTVHSEIVLYWDEFQWLPVGNIVMISAHSSKIKYLYFSYLWKFVQLLLTVKRSRVERWSVVLEVTAVFFSLPGSNSARASLFTQIRKWVVL